MFLLFYDLFSKSTAVQVPDKSGDDPSTYKPLFSKNNATGVQEWHISMTDLDYLADGCYVLGCAGGESPAASRLQLREMDKDGHRTRVIDSSSLKDEACIYWGGHMGSPATSNERLQPLETVHAVTELKEYLRHEDFDALMGLEIGGGNGMEPFLVGSSRFFDRPVIDGDWMGRACPTYRQTTLAVYAPGELVPCAIDSGDGKTILMTKASNDEIVDRALRASCAEMGSRVGMAAKPATTDPLAESTNTLSTIAVSINELVGGSKSAKVLFRGKIVAVEQRLFKGHSYGSFTIASLSRHEQEDDDSSGFSSKSPAFATGGTLNIPFQNGNIYAEHTAEDGSKSYVASVPDLIAVLDASSGKSLGVPEFKHGFRVTVLGITCSPRWTETKAGLDIGGPRAFGNDMDYKPLGEYSEPRSVIEEYGELR